MTIRSTYLQSAVIEWLRLDTEISLALGDDGNVQPVAITQTQRGKGNAPNPRISVGASMTSTDRENMRESKAFEVRVIVDGAVGKGIPVETVEDLSRLQDRVADIITEHHPGWEATGIIAEEELAWSDDLGRHAGVLSAGYERDDPAAPHEA